MFGNEQGTRSAGVRGGVSRKRKVGVLATLVALPVALLAVPAGASAVKGMQATQECTAEELPLPNGWSNVDVVGADPSGQFLVGTIGDGSVLWNDGEVEEVDAPGSYPSVNDVNSSGVAIGTALHADSYIVSPFVYEDGVGRWLPPENHEYEPTGINDAGDIVGYGYTGEYYQPLLWPADEPGKVRELSLAGASGGGVIPVDISNEGVIVGQERGKGERHVFVWPDADSDGSRLESPSGSDQVRAYDINGDWVAGREGNGDEAVGVLWNLADGTATELPEPLTAVNSDGDATTAAGETASLFRDGTEIELPALDDASVGRGTHVAFDRGAPYVAAGSELDADGTEHPVVWSGC